MRFRTLPPLLAILLLMSLPPTASEESDGTDWVITQDTELAGTSVDVEGNVTIEAGARLTLQGSTVRVGGLLHILPGAVLEMLPSGGTPSRLSALGGDAEFWIQVDGEMRSRGRPASEITGLWGDGLSSTLWEPGGIQVHGQAILEDIHIHNGTAGVFAADGSSVEMYNATIGGLGEVGVTVEGDLRLANTTVVKNGMGLAAKGPCTIDIQDARFMASENEHMLINGCDAKIEDSILDGAGVAMAANNRADVTVLDTVIRNYTIDGLGSYGSARDGQSFYPTVRFRNVLFSPAPQADRGADIENAALVEFVNVTLNGHASHGIRAKQAVLSIQDSSIEANGGHGIQMGGGYFRDDPLSAGNRFGGQDAETLNSEAAISHLAVVRAWGVDAAGHAVAHGSTSLQVHHARTGEPVEVLYTRELGQTGREVVFETFTTGPDGQPVWLGPFRYEASHTEGAGVVEGEVDLSGPILISVPEPNEAWWTPLARPAPWFLFAAGGIVVAAAGFRRSGQHGRRRD